jgi:hypothetical protein
MELSPLDDDWIPLPERPRRRGVVWPFYLDRRQLALLRGIREVWAGLHDLDLCR